MFRGPLSVLLLRLGVVAFVYTVLRFIFWGLNYASFPDPPWISFIGGIRFDLSAIAWLHLPWVIMVLFSPNPGRVMARIQFWTFMAINAITLFFQCVDLEYYKFSLKRSTADFLDIMVSGSDTAMLAPAFIRDFWYIALIYIACLLFLGWIYRKIGSVNVAEKPSVGWQIGWRVIAVTLLALCSRGGTQLIPIQVLDAAQYGGANELPLVLNTPFTMMTSLGKASLPEYNYMLQTQADEIWPVEHKLRGSDEAISDPQQLIDRPNIVVIILESFSAVYSNRSAGGEGFMPFLDSLMGQGLNMTNAYANGRRSIDGIPAILASMPKWMDEAFLTSPYASLPFTSLPSLLNAEGYSTSFYHGGRNGTMGFDGFAHSASFQHYKGLNEYTGDPSNYDGHWGIRDAPYLQYYAQELGTYKTPFFSSVFTLSSHHPYELTAADAEKFKGGALPIHPTLRYTDDALRQYFATAQNQPWFNKTLFVITADHTADIERSGSHSDKAVDHWVPLLYYMPSAIKPKVVERITQHIDILPTIMELIGYKKTFFSFGQPAINPTTDPVAIMNSNGIYSIFTAQGHLKFDGDKVLERTSNDKDEQLSKAESDRMELVLKAVIQQYNGRLLNGRTTVSEPVK